MSTTQFSNKSRKNTIKNAFSSWTLQKKFVVIILISTLPALAISGILIVQIVEQQHTDEILSKLDAVSQIQENRIVDLIGNNYEHLQKITSSTLLKIYLDNYNSNGDLSELERIKTIIFDVSNSVKSIHDIFVLNPEGKIISSTDPDIFDMNYADQSIFLHSQNGNFLTLEKDGENPTMLVAGPMLLENKFLGIAVLAIDPLTITHVLQQENSLLGNTGETFMAKRTETGDALFITPLRFDNNAAFSKIIPKENIDVPITQALLKNENTFTDTIDYRQKPVVSSTRYIDELDWGLVVKQDKEEIDILVTNVKTQASLSIIIISVLVIFGTLYFTSTIIQPIRRLKNLAIQISKGNYEKPIQIASGDEIGKLSEQFEKMRISILESFKNTEDMKTALDESSIIAITDAEGTIKYVNKQFCEISKYSKEELLGKNHRILKSGHHSVSFYAGLWKTISEGRVWRGDIKNRAKDGSYYWVRTVILPFLGKEGKPKEYIAVRTDITSQMEYSEKLKRAISELSKLDQQKDEFASMVTHELKTPLTPIRGYCEMLKDYELLGKLNAEQLNAVQEIEDNSKQLERLISDVLDAQKIDLKKMKFNKKEFRIDEFMKKISENYSIYVHDKNIELVNACTSNISLTSDPNRLEQVLSNLIKNAIDFVPQKGGRIEIGAKQEDLQIIFYVKDNGIGISTENQKHLFKKFYQIDTSITRKHGGTGLGLTICNGIIDGLGGKIWINSEYGKGSIFYFSIPLEAKIVA